MIFGIPREIKQNEYRVGAMPFLVRDLTRRNHQVFVETGAGDFCEASDSHYERMGATIVPSAEKLYASAEVILKVLEPQPVEFDLIRPDQIVMAFFHFIKHPELVKALAGRGATCIAYELIEDNQHQFPISRPISRLAGQMSVLNGSYYLQKHTGGRGIVLGHVTGSQAAQVTILGAGNVGQQAAITAAKLGAHVVILDKDFDKLQQLDAMGFNNITSLIYSEEYLRELLPRTDLLITCIQMPGMPTPSVITQAMVKTMRTGAVIIDVDVDLGGSIETCKNTSHENPTFVLDGIVHYCVSNITATVPRIASRALSAAISPYLTEIAEKGFEQTILTDPVFARGVSIYKGYVVNQKLAALSDMPHSDLAQKIKDLNPAN